MTWWVLSASRTAATASGVIGAEMSTPEISAPILGEIGSTGSERGMVTPQFCQAPNKRASPRPTTARVPLLSYIGPPHRHRAPGGGRVRYEHRGRRAPRADAAASQLLTLVPVDAPPGGHRPRGPPARGRRRRRPGRPPGLARPPEAPPPPPPPPPAPAPAPPPTHP